MVRKQATTPKHCSLTVNVENPEGHRLARQRVKLVSGSGAELELRTDDEGQAYFESLPRNTRWKVFVNGTDTGEVAELEKREEELEVEYDEEEVGDDDDEEGDDDDEADSYSDDDEL